MITATVEFEPGQIEALRARMQAMREMTGRSARAVVYATTKDFLYAAVRVTPMAARTVNRKVISRKGKPGIVAFLKPRGGGNPRLVVTSWNSAEKWGLRRRISTRALAVASRFGYGRGQYWPAKWLGRGREQNYGRGFAKAGWLAGLAKLGAGSGKATPMAMGFADVVKMLNNQVPAISVANQVPYIEELDRGGPRRPPANIMVRALDAAMVRMDRTLERLARNFEAQFEGGTVQEISA